MAGKRCWGLVGVLAVIAALALPAAAAGAADVRDESPEYVPNEVVVGLKPAGPGISAAVDSAVRIASGVDSRPVVGIPGTRVVELAEATTVESVVRRLERRGDVAWAEPNYVLRIQSLPNDPLFGSLWGLRNVGQNTMPFNEVAPIFGRPGTDIGASAAWQVSTGGGGNIGIVDSGIAATHPDLAPNLNRSLSRNFVAVAGTDVVDPGDWDDPHGHGTHVAGTIGAVGNNGLGVAGVNWKTNLVALRACRFDGSCTSADVAAAFAWAGNRRIPVVNVSLGNDPGEVDPEMHLIRKAIRSAPGSLFVIAAGNEANNNDRVPAYPCALGLKNILCVASIGARGGISDSSNWGRKSVDLAAPGEYIQSTFVERAYPFEQFFDEGISNWDQQPYPWKLASFEDDDWLTFDGKNGVVPAPVPEASATLDEPVTLTGLQQCRLSFDLNLDLHGSQTFGVEYRVDGGPARQALPVFDREASTNGEPIEASADLSPADGADAVELAFVFRAHGTITPLPVIQISSVTVRCNGPMPPGGTYRYLSGTSMATPHVAGAAGLVRSVRPKIGTLGLKRALMRSAVKLKSLRGKTVTSGRVDAGRAIRWVLPAPKAKLGPLRPGTRRLRLRPTRTGLVRATIRNRGDAAARSLRLCLRAPPRLIRGSRCTGWRLLRPGRPTIAFFRLRPVPRAAGRTVRLRIRATARGLRARRSTVRLSVGSR